MSGLKDTICTLNKFFDKCILKSSHNPQGWSPERIFLLGFSQGGIMALSMAILGLECSIGGVVSICGWFHIQESKLKRKSTNILITQGNADPALTIADIPRKVYFAISIL